MSRATEPCSRGGGEGARRARPARTGMRLAGALAVAAMVLAGCSPTVTRQSQTNPLEGAQQAPAGLQQFYEAKPKWGKCSDGKAAAAGATCASFKVPLNYDAPDGRTITIVAAKLAAQEKKLGTLFVNPGGPGGSGVDFVATVREFLPGEVVDHFDLIGFDPRGVGQSTPLRCHTDKQLDELLASPSLDMDDPAGREETARRLAQWGANCQQADAQLMRYMDTQSVARDLDVMRAQVGDKKLSYAGFSYGSYLGATYVDLFPGNVGRVLLDGILAPNYTMDQVARSQAIGLEASLRHFAQFCIGTKTCPLKGTPDEGVAQIGQLIDRLNAQPMPVADSQRSLTGGLALTAVIAAMYNQAAYPALRIALHDAMVKHDGAQMLALADHYTERNPDGTYANNSIDAFTAINMVDYQAVGTPQDWERDAKEIAAKAPVIGREMGYSAIGLHAWPVKSRYQRHAVSGKGAAPVLLIGNTHDPATPLDMAKALHSTLQDSRLITLDSWDHTSLGSGSECVEDAVTDYLLRGKLPGSDIRCEQ